MVGRLLKIIGLFSGYRSLLWGSFANETYHFEDSLYHFEEPTNRSHPIAVSLKEKIRGFAGFFCKRALLR